MRRAPALLLLPLLVSLSALAATTTPTPAPVVSPAPDTVREQLARGETTYFLACAICHGDRLEGLSAPELGGEDFRALYHPLPPRALHDLIRDSMPYDRRGTLSAQEVLDVTAYLLHENDLPRPDGPLTADLLDQAAPEHTTGDAPGH